MGEIQSCCRGVRHPSHPVFTINSSLIFSILSYLSKHSHFERDPEASGNVVPEQWNFAQWAGQSKELAALFKEDKDQPEAK